MGGPIKFKFKTMHAVAGMHVQGHYITSQKEGVAGSLLAVKRASRLSATCRQSIYPPFCANPRGNPDPLECHHYKYVIRHISYDRKYMFTSLLKNREAPNLVVLDREPTCVELFLEFSGCA